ncbi:MAG: right-handed parallel beta-helix repeat-containing protein [Eubacteriales bacterium]|nr:right-handed parallel beta-helix repeat-containing protein [Eubacteriales bacterium]
MIYYVDAAAIRSGDGTKERPFRTISEAARVAAAGDEVLVFPGVYREAVNPAHAGREDARVVYRSVERRQAHITGAEPAKGWERLWEGVWKLAVPNGLFGDYNPYTTRVSGDWFNAAMVAHTGDVFLNEKSMYEVTDAKEVYEPKKSKGSWDPEFSLYTWYTEQDETSDSTVFLANFGKLNPNEEQVEITVRRNCFYPSAEGIGYITLSGFKVSKAATQWAPPTAYQEGMIGPHWSKGWIIEDCEVYESKCSGISLGKYLQPENDNKWLKYKYKDGTQTERDCICQASYEGWNKEKIGSHIIRRCEIHDCGQTGIVGHLGGVFSLIEDNHIYNINNKQNLAGAEIGGIKMHAAIDVVFRRNHIHHCTRGIWLDWQAQGTRVTQNLFYDNCLPQEMEPCAEAAMGIGEDLFIEVSHGPTLVDNNIMLSDRSIKLATQGTAFVHNLIAGGLVSVGIGTDNGAEGMPSPRYTPYHKVHGTEVAGFMTILHGDDRFYNNIFLQKPYRPLMNALFQAMSGSQNPWDDCNIEVGTHVFDEYPTFAEWDAHFDGYCGMNATDVYVNRYYDHLPVWCAGNVYLSGARHWSKEEQYCEDASTQYTAVIEHRPDGVYLVTNVYDAVADFAGGIISTKVLGEAFEPEQRFENPNGTPITFNEDFFGKSRTLTAVPGPLAEGCREIRLF